MCIRDRFNFTQGLSSINIPNIVNGNLPQKVIIGIVEHEANSGNYKTLDYKLSPFGLRGVSLHVNGQPYGRDYEMLYNGVQSLCSRPFYLSLIHISEPTRLLSVW